VLIKGATLSIFRVQATVFFALAVASIALAIVAKYAPDRGSMGLYCGFFSFVAICTTIWAVIRSHLFRRACARILPESYGGRWWGRFVWLATAVDPLILIYVIAMMGAHSDGQASHHRAGGIAASVATPGTAYTQYTGPSFTFLYPAYLQVPPPERFDIEKVRAMLAPQGVEILTVLMSQDGDRSLQVSRSRSNATFADLLQQKTNLAASINSQSMNVMGNQFVKFAVDEVQLPDGRACLRGYGTKSDGQVGITLEFLEQGFDYALQFIYKNDVDANGEEVTRNKAISSLQFAR
jgi:hypothetical protein